MTERDELEESPSPEETPVEAAEKDVPPEKEETLPFEKALARLERIVQELEGGRLPVDDMMKRFEEGMKLADYCNARLNEIRGRIEVLVKKADGSLDWQEVDPGQLA